MVEMREPIQRLCAKCGYMTVTQYGEHLQAVNTALLEALEKAASALDKLMGDSDLDGDDSPEFKACQAAHFAIRAAKGDKS